ncbi:hypothetical protein Pyn_10123 [Prunus yedoensis var. nudiflora]|uniref:Uncharacterized protein n=1 Tax=Prunus yedoensis var. nudiflora TaxID=2094558 RepID=A0A314YS86_PRUYE|nr:hypothetical protein Pyn_10123 [Prunus yedoensis var. nudiflora]
MDLDALWPLLLMGNMGSNLYLDVVDSLLGDRSEADQIMSYLSTTHSIAKIMVLRFLHQVVLYQLLYLTLRWTRRGTWTCCCHPLRRWEIWGRISTGTF